MSDALLPVQVLRLIRLIRLPASLNVREIVLHRILAIFKTGKPSTDVAAVADVS
jgi:hypothetical protein